MLLKKCIECDKEMKVKPSQVDRKKYCSLECKYSYQRKNKINQHLKTEVSLICDYCKKDFERKKSLVNELNNFCCTKCSYSYRNENIEEYKKHFNKGKNYENIICGACNKSFFVPPNRKDTAKYCSKNCLGKSNGVRGKLLYSKKVHLCCDHCNKEVIKKPSVVRKLNFCSVECMGIYYSENKLYTGKNNGAWKGGKTFYYGIGWSSCRKMIRRRQCYKCEDCGMSEEKYGKQLSIHHIIPFRMFEDYKEANNLFNLVGLCEPCHKERHREIRKLGW